MKLRFAATIITGLLLGAPLARATPFTFTTESPEGFGFIDLETASVSGGVGKADRLGTAPHVERDP
jgi:undecaprenyl pyrophosphate phosphatase UppP